MKTHKSKVSRKGAECNLEHSAEDFDEFAEGRCAKKATVECICPSCRTLYTMKMNWVGRGVPRKFCQSCRDKNALIEG
jgi:hypothetical protein